MPSLIIDNDLGFVFWLGQTLDRSGYETFPAKTIPDALKLIDELNLSLGLVILNSSLEGADTLIATLRRSQKYLKIILLVENPDAPMHPEVDLQWRKPEEIDQNSEGEWLQIIQKAFAVRAVSY